MPNYFIRDLTLSIYRQSFKGDWATMAAQFYSLAASLARDNDVPREVFHQVYGIAKTAMRFSQWEGQK